MALILNIDTATANASVCLSSNDEILAIEKTDEQKNHAAFLQPAIANICKKTNKQLTAIEAVAITAGPGSYTGLRVGMASAKGICYALNIPLITVNTLEVIALGAYSHLLLLQQNFENLVICPMIDARRMEVFTAMYATNLTELTAPHAEILDENSFSETLAKQQVLFCGDAASKFHQIGKNKQAIFSTYQHQASDLAKISSLLYAKQSFANLAYSQPFYLKEFHNPLK